MNAKAVGTTDGRVLALSSLDLPMPATRPIINDFTRHMTEDLMRQMAIKWALPPEFDPIEVRIYKAASIDDSSKLASWIKKTPGVSKVDLAQAVGLPGAYRPAEAEQAKDNPARTARHGPPGQPAEFHPTE